MAAALAAAVLAAATTAPAPPVEIFEAPSKYRKGLRRPLRDLGGPDWSKVRARARLAKSATDPAIDEWHALLARAAQAMCPPLDASAWPTKAPSAAAGEGAKRELGLSTGGTKRPASDAAGAAGGAAAKKPSPAAMPHNAIQSRPFREIQHSPGTCPWLTVQAEARKTMPTFTLTGLRSWDRPQDAVFHAAGLQPTLSATKWVWHGSAGDGVYGSIVGNGFQPQLSGRTTGHIYGHGTYFARDAKYSHDYAYRPGGSSDPRRQLLLCSIRPGESCRGVQGMKLAPLKPGRTDGERFNSFVNDVADPSIYVIQHQCQMRPMYEVTYTV